MPTFYQVNLHDIRDVSISELSNSKLHALDNSYDSFDYQVNNCNSENAVCLSGNIPYEIINGRHRVYLARKKGWKTIKARFA